MAAPARRHRYELTVTWLGNRGRGTAGYRAYSREHEIVAGDRPAIRGSSDPRFRGDAAHWDPERLLVASLSQCHLLWYLHLCSISGVVVATYEDNPAGVMQESDDGGGRFAEVTLRPEVAVVEATMVDAALELHDRAHALCFIANSVNFPVRHEPTVTVA